MYVYKIKINCLPKLIWACEVTVENYEWRNRNSKDVLEISYSKFDTKSVTLNNNNFLLKNNDLSCIVADENRTASLKSGKPITIVSVAVSLSDFKYQPCELVEADLSDETVLILPFYLEELPINYELEIIKKIHEIIKLSSADSENRKIDLASAFFNLICEIDKITRNNICSQNNSVNYYVKKLITLSNPDIMRKSLSSQLHQS